MGYKQGGNKKMKTTSKILSILLVLAMVLSIAPFAFAAGADTGVVINEVYGGGNSGAVYTNDFVELYNPTDADISLKGYSLQYASYNGTFSAQNVFSFADDAAIKANGYYLVQLAAGSTVKDKPLSGVDATGNLNLAGKNGKIALVKGTDAISGKDDPKVVDFVGFGTANEFEGTGATVAPDNANSVSRTNGKDTNDNTADFAKGAPTPQGSGNASAGTGSEGGTGTEGGNQGGTETAPALKDISVALAGANDASFKVKGVVTCVDGQNIYLQDATGAICARMSEKPTDIKLGDTIIAVGKKSVYNGLPQLGSATYEKSTGLTLTAKETTIGALTDADICGYVSLKDLEVTEVYDNDGQFSSPNITVKDAEGKTIQLYKAVIEKKDGAWTVKVGDVIDVKAAVSIYNKLQLRNTSADEIVVQVKDTTPTPNPDPTPEHEHKLTKVEKVDATTEKEGCKEHYKCECGKLFTDAEGKNETTAGELAIAKLTNTETDKKDDTSDKKDETTGSGYTKVTDGKLVSGTYVLVTSNGYAPTVLEKNWLLSAQPTVSGNKVTDAKNAVLVLTVDGNKVKITDAKGNTVINQAKNNKLDNLDGMWNWKYDSATGTFTFDDGVTEEGQTRYLAAAGKNDNKFRAYRNPSSEPDSYGNTYYHQFTLYKLTDGSNVSTGDNTNVVAIVAIMIVAMAGMAVIVTNRKNWNV